jgi:chromosome segregation ATPase
MFGFITKRAHRAAGRVWAEELVTLTTARDSLAIQVDEQNRRIVSLEADLRAKNNRITNMQKDIDRMEAEAKANARFVEVGRKRLAALAKQNEQAKAKRRAAA